MSLAGRTARSFLVRRFRWAAFEFPHLVYFGENRPNDWNGNITNDNGMDNSTEALQSCGVAAYRSFEGLVDFGI